MIERHLTFHVVNNKRVRGTYGIMVALKEFWVRGARVNPMTVCVGGTFQTVVREISSLAGSERWRFDGPYKSWEPGGVIAFEAMVLDAREVVVTLAHEPKDLVWHIPVAGVEK